MTRMGVVLVHGIGDIKPTNVLASAVLGIKKSFPKAKFERVKEIKIADKENAGKINICHTSLENDDIFLRLFEFHWKDIYKRVTFKRPMTSILEVALMFGRATRLCLDQRTPKINELFRLFYFYFFLTALLILISPVTILVAAFPKYLAAADMAYFNQVISIVPSWVVTIDLMLLIPFLFLYGISGVAGFFIKNIRWNMEKISVFMIFLTLLHGGLGTLINYSNQLATSLIFIKQDLVISIPLLTSLSVPVQYRFYLFILYIPVIAFFTLLINLLNDIVHYLAPDANGRVRKDQIAIREFLIKTIDHIKSNNMQHIVLVTHSLGTVIAIDTLVHLSKRGSKRTPAKIHVVTSGSPLRRYIYKLIPHRRTSLESVLSELSSSRTIKINKVLNAFRLFDYVGQALTFSYLPFKCFRRQILFEFNLNGVTINEAVLAPRLTSPYLHSNYWDDYRFIDLISEHIISPEVRGMRGRSLKVE